MKNGEKKLDGLTFDELLSFHRNALKYYNPWTPQREPTLESESSSFVRKETESNMELIRRVTIDLNATKKDNLRLKEEAKMLAAEKKRVYFKEMKRFKIWGNSWMRC